MFGVRRVALGGQSFDPVSVNPDRAPHSRILVRRVCGLGDLILTLRFLRALRCLHPASEVHLLAHRQHVDLFRAAGVVECGFPEEGSGWHVVYEGRELPSSARLRPDPRDYHAIYLFVRAPARSPLVRSLGSALPERVHAIAARPPEDDPGHASRYPLQFLQLRGRFWAPDDYLSLHVPVAPEQAEAHTIGRWSAKGRRPVIFHPGSGSPRKNWPPERFICLLERIVARFPDVVPFLLEGPSDAEAVRAVLAGLKEGASLQVLRFPDLLDLACALQESAILVGNDSGVTHLAAALGIPTVAVFGPSNPIQWAPLGPRLRVLYRENQDCEPCHLREAGLCAYGTCLRFPSVEEVEEGIQNLLGGEMECG